MATLFIDECIYGEMELFLICGSIGLLGRLDWSSASNGSMAALEGGSGRLGTALSYPCLASVSSVSATTTTAAAAPVSFSVGSAPLQSSSVSSQSAAETEPLAPVVSPPSPLQSSRSVQELSYYYF